MTTPPSKKPPSWLQRNKTPLLFWVGLAGLIAETIGSLGFQRTPDPSLLIIFGGMMGLTAFLPGKKDE